MDFVNKKKSTWNYDRKGYELYIERVYYVFPFFDFDSPSFSIMKSEDGEAIRPGRIELVAFERRKPDMSLLMEIKTRTDVKVECAVLM